VAKKFSDELRLFVFAKRGILIESISKIGVLLGHQFAILTTSIDIISDPLRKLRSGTARHCYVLLAGAIAIVFTFQVHSSCFGGATLCEATGEPVRAGWTATAAGRARPDRAGPALLAGGPHEGIGKVLPAPNSPEGRGANREASTQLFKSWRVPSRIDTHVGHVGTAWTNSEAALQRRLRPPTASLRGRRRWRGTGGAAS